MPKPLHFLGRYALIVAMAFLCGGQWLVLQTVAWSWMMVTYSQDRSPTAALTMILDGAHPCQLCKGIAEAKKSQGDQPSLLHVAKIEVFQEHTAGLLIQMPDPWELEGDEWSAVVRMAEPRVRPPRQA